LYLHQRELHGGGAVSFILRLAADLGRVSGSAALECKTGRRFGSSCSKSSRGKRDLRILGKMVKPAQGKPE
jgi:hypothetical protein